MAGPHSKHSILKDVFDGDLSALRVFFENGGSTSAWSEHTIWSTVYDEDTSALRVVGVGGVSPVKYYGKLGTNKDVSEAWYAMPWTDIREYGIDHTDGNAAIVIPETGDYIIMATLTVDYDQAGETITAELQKKAV